MEKFSMRNGRVRYNEVMLGGELTPMDRFYEWKAGVCLRMEKRKRQHRQARRRSGLRLHWTGDMRRFMRVCLLAIVVLAVYVGFQSLQPIPFHDPLFYGLMVLLILTSLMAFMIDAGPQIMKWWRNRRQEHYEE